MNVEMKIKSEETWILNRDLSTVQTNSLATETLALKGTSHQAASDGSVGTHPEVA